MDDMSRPVRRHILQAGGSMLGQAYWSEKASGACCRPGDGACWQNWHVDMLAGGTGVGSSQVRTGKALLIQGGLLSETVAKLPKGNEADRQVDRRVLRSVLLEPVRDRVRFDSELVSYAVRDDSVTARFPDGSSAKGSLLVGADGIRSRVARQLVGDAAQPRDLGVRIVYGKTPADAALLESLHPVLRHGTSFVTDTDPAGRRVLLVQEVMRFSHKDAPQDYVFWALSAPKEAFDDSDAPAAARRLTAEWHPDIRVLIDRQSPDDTALLNMSASPASTWETNARVTVLGDAIHCMPPTGGQGANSAIYDAALLGFVLGAADGWDKETTATYERGMRHNIGDIVGLACIGLSGLLGVDAEV